MGEYEVIGWSYILFVKPDGSVRTGRNTLNLFNPPLKRPPLDESNVIHYYYYYYLVITIRCKIRLFII